MSEQKIYLMHTKICSCGVQLNFMSRYDNKVCDGYTSTTANFPKLYRYTLSTVHFPSKGKKVNGLLPVSAYCSRCKKLHRVNTFYTYLSLTSYW